MREIELTIGLPWTHLSPASMIDHFDEMLHQSRNWPLVYSVALHPFIIGQPFRLRALRRALAHILEHRAEIWLTTPGAIADYCIQMPKGTIPCPAA